jgi:hypothetical protein
MDAEAARKLVRETAAEVLGYEGNDAKGILRGDFDDKWDCLRVAKEAVLRATADNAR